jgi:hypothetical protein
MEVWMTTTVNDPTADTFASLGLDHIFVEFLVRPLGATFELHADLVQYNAFTGRYLQHKIGRQIAEDADDAIEAACDLEWDAHKVLTDMDVNGTCKSPCGFGEAIEKLFNGGYGPYVIAAE